MIAVLAGTPVDTAMGMAFLSERGIVSKGYNVSRTPEEQNHLQVVQPERLLSVTSGLLEIMKEEGISTVFVYCNSIAAAVDMDYLSMKHKMKIITPLHVYIEMGQKHRCLGVMAANNQSTHGIERAIQEKSPDTEVIGTGILKLVSEIEKGNPPLEIIEKYDLLHLLKFYQHAGCEAVILGCTHFSYLHEELMRISPLPLIDPAVFMMQWL